jgi:hypothetical protein
MEKGVQINSTKYSTHLHILVRLHDLFLLGLVFDLAIYAKQVFLFYSAISLYMIEENEEHF